MCLLIFGKITFSLQPPQSETNKNIGAKAKEGGDLSFFIFLKPKYHSNFIANNNFEFTYSTYMGKGKQKFNDNYLTGARNDDDGHDYVGHASQTFKVNKGNSAWKIINVETLEDNKDDEGNEFMFLGVEKLKIDGRIVYNHGVITDRSDFNVHGIYAYGAKAGIIENVPNTDSDNDESPEPSNPDDDAGDSGGGSWDSGPADTATSSGGGSSGGSGGGSNAKPDLVVQEIDFRDSHDKSQDKYTVGKTINIWAKIKNIGTGDYKGDDVIVKFYVNNVYVGSTEIIDLEANKRWWALYEYVAEKKGDHKVKVIITNTSGESDTSNNARTAFFEAEAPKPPTESEFANYKTIDWDVFEAYYKSQSKTLRGDYVDGGYAHEIYTTNNNMYGDTQIVVKGDFEWDGASGWKDYIDGLTPTGNLIDDFGNNKIIKDDSPWLPLIKKMQQEYNNNKEKIIIKNNKHNVPYNMEIKLDSFNVDTEITDFFANKGAKATEFPMSDIRHVALLHWARNLLHDPVKDYATIVRDKNEEFHRVSDDENAFHRFDGKNNKYNVKFTKYPSSSSDRASSEYIVNENHDFVTDKTNGGSFNFFDVKSSKLKHFTYDVQPWIAFGNGFGDTTLVGGEGGRNGEGIDVPTDWGSGERNGDTMSYEKSSKGVSLNLKKGEGYTGAARHDKFKHWFKDIQNIIGSDHSDIIAGNNNSNTLEGGKGHDILFGTMGNDTLKGGEGNDTLYGESGRHNKLDGGDGTDTAVYAEYNQGDLTIIKEQSNYYKVLRLGGGEDTLTNIEKIQFKGGNVKYISEIAREYREYKASIQSKNKMTFAYNQFAMSDKDKKGYDDSFDVFGNFLDNTIDKSNSNGNVDAGEGDDKIKLGDNKQSKRSRQVDGGKGHDYVVYDGSRNDYTITKQGDKVKVGTNTDILTNIEFIKFDDGGVHTSDLNTLVPTLSLADMVTVTESDQDVVDVVTVSVIITLDAATTQDITFDWQTADATAESGVDYKAASGTITIAAGQKQQTIKIEIMSDYLFEDDEYFKIAMNNLQNAVFQNGKTDYSVIVMTENDDDHDFIKVGTILGEIINTENGGAGKGDDRIMPGGGNDKVWASFGNDSIIDGLGDNKLYGESGMDRIMVFSGLNMLDGGSESDYLVGGLGSDNLFGKHGNDILVGDVFGWRFFAGSDTLTGGAGNDTSMGGGGADGFVFKPNEGTDTIGAFKQADVSYNSFDGFRVTPAGADFEPGVDYIVLKGFATINQSNVMQFVKDDNGNALFTAEGTSILFYGVSLSSINSTDFIFQS